MCVELRVTCTARKLKKARKFAWQIPQQVDNYKGCNSPCVELHPTNTSRHKIGFSKICIHPGRNVNQPYLISSSL
jgi:hypothetical protein